MATRRTRRVTLTMADIRGIIRRKLENCEDGVWIALTDLAGAPEFIGVHFDRIMKAVATTPRVQTRNGDFGTELAIFA